MPLPSEVRSGAIAALPELVLREVVPLEEAIAMVEAFEHRIVTLTEEVDRVEASAAAIEATLLPSDLDQLLARRDSVLPHLFDVVQAAARDERAALLEETGVAAEARVAAARLAAAVLVADARDELLAELREQGHLVPVAPDAGAATGCELPVSATDGDGPAVVDAVVVEGPVDPLSVIEHELPDFAEPPVPRAGLDEVADPPSATDVDPQAAAHEEFWGPAMGPKRAWSFSPAEVLFPLLALTLLLLAVVLLVG